MKMLRVSYINLVFAMAEAGLAIWNIAAQRYIGAIIAMGFFVLFLILMVQSFRLEQKGDQLDMQIKLLDRLKRK